MLLSLQVQPLRFLVSVAALGGTLVVLLNTYKADCVDKFSLLMHFPLVLVEVVTNRKLLSTPVTLLYKVLMVTFNMLNLLPV